MKTKRWILTTLVILIAAIGFATDTPKMDIKATEAEKTLVSFESVSACPVEITIMCESGEILYYWKSETQLEKLDRFFDLSDVSYGKYKVCVNYGVQSLNRELFVTRKGISVGPTVQLYEPFFMYSDNRLKLSFLNLAQKSVYLNIYENGKHVTGLNLGKDIDMQKSFDFSNLNNGEYDVVLSDYFSEHHYVVRK